jgi:hypothetical protein
MIRLGSPLIRERRKREETNEKEKGGYLIEISLFLVTAHLAPSPPPQPGPVIESTTVCAECGHDKN